MHREELSELLEQINNQLDAFEMRALNVIEASAIEFCTGYSTDRSTSATTSGDGRKILDLQMNRGFGDLNRPAWMLSDDIDLACRGIVEAINSARRQAIDRSIEALENEFPEAFDLLKDLAQ
ncbi:hypothetical protein [Nocardia asteroides]|uniref:hypothetical protein n=1 Tax=Nocardia asteroides TaxID=1824 RepID=UPI001E388EC2|nr:hypothetical protein [Nocardia asteroides]UGT64745.1 hypothetical protein LTT61_16320 [Nocardia asteroides]